MLLINVGVFSEEKTKKIDSEIDTTACCTRTSSSGEAGTPSFVSVTVTKCYGGKTREAALVAACHNASAAAALAVASLVNTTVDVIPTK